MKGLMEQMDTMLNLLTLIVAKLRLVLWNTNGLAQQKQVLQIFLDEHKIADVRLIFETQFTDRAAICTPTI